MGRLVALVTSAALEAAQRSRQIGWLFKAASDAFAYLIEDFEYAVGEVVVHHESSFVEFTQDRRSILVEYTPSSGDIRCSIVDRPRASMDPPRSVEAWEVLKAREPATDWAAWPNNRGDPQIVSDLIRRWADGLRRLAPDLLRGAESGVAPWVWWRIPKSD